jgi:hypothetical protein
VRKSGAVLLHITNLAGICHESYNIIHLYKRRHSSSYRTASIFVPVAVWYTIASTPVEPFEECNRHQMADFDPTAV